MSSTFLRYTLLFSLASIAASAQASGTWTSTASMSEVRTSAAAALLSDGRVLVTGGTGANGPTASAETYSGGAFASAGVMVSPRIGHTATLLRDGRVLVTGGNNGTGTTNSAEVFDPADGSWTVLGSAMVDARSGHTATLLPNGNVLIAGGGAQSVEVFDASTNSFSFVGSLNTVRSGHAAALLENGKVLIAGGADDSDTALASVEIFDPIAGSSASAASLSTPRKYASATTVLCGNVVVIGGNDGSNDLGSAERYSPGSNTWTVINGGTPRSGHVAVLLPHNNRILVAGGTSGGTAVAASELFESWTNTFKTTGAMNDARSAAVGSALKTDGRVLVAGGDAATAEIYRFATIKTDKDDYAPGETVQMSGSGWQAGERVSLRMREHVNGTFIEFPEYQVIADAAGNIAFSEYAPTENDLGAHYHLVAAGSQSGWQAQTKFTDGNPQTLSLTPPSISVTQGTSANYSIKVTVGGNNNQCTVGFTATLPTGATGSPNPSSVTTTNVDITSALSVGTAGLQPGTYTVSVTAVRGANCQGNGNLTASAALVVLAPPDTTAPVITPVIEGTLGDNDWYRSNVKLTWTVTDPESTVTSKTGCDESNLIADTAGQAFTCTATSAGGTSSQSVTIKRDATAPTAALSVTAGTLGDNGWYTSSVTVHTTGTDALSGIASCTADQSQTTETAGQEFNASCSDNAGNTTNAAPLTVKLDKSGPTATLSPSGSLGDNGWYVGDVTIATTGADTISSPVTCTGVQTQTTDTAGQTFSGSCTNNAGLTTTAEDITVKRDATAPTGVAGAPNRPADHNGWYNQAVNVVFTGTDATSGIATCTTASYNGPDSTTASANGSCKDKAGNSSAAVASSTFKYDATAPVNVSGAPNRAPDHNGWYNQAVDVVFTGEDATSTIDTCTTVNYSTPDSATAKAQGTCTDKAGNTSLATASSSFQYDATAPNVMLKVTGGTLGDNGWYVSDVTLQTSGTDATSGIDAATCTADQSQTEETIGQSFNGSCKDNAGNTGNASAVTVKLDKTGPSAVLTPSGTLGTNGWFISNVTISTTGEDNVSSPVTCTAAQSLNVDTTGQLFNGSCKNDAGLSTNATGIVVKRDTVAPALAPSISPTPIVLNGSNYTASPNATDATSGVVAQSCDAVNTSAVGLQSLSCSATDAAGHVTPLAFNYNVVYATGGQCLGSPGHEILQPINPNLPGTIETGNSVWKQGSTIPAKFRVCDANGNSIGTAGVVAGFSLYKTVNGTITNVDETMITTSTNDLGWRFDPTAAQWIYNMTSKVAPLNRANSTYYFRIYLNDGTSIYFNFGLK